MSKEYPLDGPALEINAHWERDRLKMFCVGRVKELAALYRLGEMPSR